MTNKNHTPILEEVIGPRVPAEEYKHHPLRYLAPTLCFLAAAISLMASIFFPYWELKLKAPQYPKGLYIHAYLNHTEGDVQEIDELNHYIGMRPLDQAASRERQMSIAAITTFVLLILAAGFIHNKLAALLALPTVVFPLVFLGDLSWWLRDFGTNLDPKAPLSNAIKPFVPPVLGIGKVGQFQTVASAGTGLYLAICASILVLIGLYLHRRAYKPLVDKIHQEHSST